MELKIENDDGAAVQVNASGRITQDQLAKNPDPFSALVGDEVYGKKLALGMAETEFLDSSGVSWLLVSHKKFGEQGGKLVIHSVPQIVLNVIKVLRMNLVFNLANDESEALQKLQESA